MVLRLDFLEEQLTIHEDLHRQILFCRLHPYLLPLLQRSWFVKYDLNNYRLRRWFCRQSLQFVEYTLLFQGDRIVLLLLLLDAFQHDGLIDVDLLPNGYLYRHMQIDCGLCSSRRNTALQYLDR